MSEIFTADDVMTEETENTSVENKPVCSCPVCGKGIYERRNKEGNVMGYFCEDRECLSMWKNNYYLTNHRIVLDRGTAVALLTDRRIKLPAIYFSKKDTTYPATLIVDFEDKKCRYRIQF